MKLQQGYLDAALQGAEQGVRESENKSLVWHSRFRLLKAETLMRLGKAGEALSLMQPDPPPNLPPDVVVRWRILRGQALCQLGSFADGKQRLQEAATLINNSDPSLSAEVTFVRGRCAWSEGQLQLAQDDFRQAQQLAEKHNDFVYASAVGNLGVMLMHADRYDEAIDEFQKILGLARSSHSPILEEKILGNIGFGYSQLGDWKRAVSFSQEAEDLAKHIKNIDDQEAWLVDLGKDHYALWELQEAERDYLQALELAEQLHNSDQMARCLHDLAELALRKKNPEKAEEYWKRGTGLSVGPERTIRLALDHAEIAAAREQWKQAETLFGALELTPGITPLLLSIVQRELGEVYWRENEIALADRTFRRGIATAEAAVAKIKDPERRILFLDQDRFYDSYIRFLVDRHRSEEALGITARSHAQVAAQVSSAAKSWHSLLNMPPVGAVPMRQPRLVLAYWVLDDESYLWVIKPQTCDLIKLAGHRALQLAIEAYNRELEDHPDVDKSPAGEELYKMLIEPAAKLIPKGSQVIIVPSKVLSSVSFEGLVVPGTKPYYWIEDADVRIAGSVATVAEPNARKSASTDQQKELLMMGAPIEVSKDFPALRDAADEMKRIERHFPAERTTMISGKDATPEAYLAAHPNDYHLIHLDTHGTPNDLSPLDSAVILSPGAEGSYKLYAREIKDIRIHANLVTISACYGAGTRWYNNEGVVGLGWAFLRAGAHQVIAGLWEADGKATADLMDDFYGELSQGKSAAQALRDAKLKMLHSTSFYRHPYYWASLQLYTGP